MLTSFPGQVPVIPVQSVYSPTKSRVIVSPTKITKPITTENINKLYDEELNKRVAAPSGKKGILEWIIFLLPVILAIMCIFGAAFLIHESLKDTKEVHSAQRILTRVNTNLNTLPIEEIEQVDVGTTCRQGFSELILGAWEGVKPGCLCEDKSEHDRPYCVFHTSCKFVREKDAIQEKIWPYHEAQLIYKENKFCVKRVSSFTHKDKNGACPTDHKTCHDGCVPNAANCPLNIVATTTLDNQRTNVVKVQGRNILFEKNELAPQSSFVNLRISSSRDGKCFDPKTNPKFASSKFYPFQRGMESGCLKDELQSSIYENLDTASEQEVFKVNKVQTTVEELPFYKEYYIPTDTFYLLGERRITVNNREECQSINTRSSESMEEYARSTNSVLHGLAITILVLSCLIILTAIIFFVLRNKKIISNNNPVKVIYILGFILLIICITLGIVYLVKREKLEETSEIYKKYVDKECFSEAPIKNASKTISGYASDVESRFSFYALYFFISALVIMLLGLALAIWRKGSQGEKQLFEKPWDSTFVN